MSAADPYGYEALRVELAHQLGTSIAFVRQQYPDQKIDEIWRTGEANGTPIADIAEELRPYLFATCSGCGNDSHLSTYEQRLLIDLIDMGWYATTDLNGDLHFSPRFGVTTARRDEIKAQMEEMGRINLDRCAVEKTKTSMSLTGELT